MSELRPFPDQPSLEFDRKAAKQLLRQLNTRDPEALQRARARGVDTSRPAEELALADAQLIVAREYGFASWPRLVQYHGDIVRQSRALEHARTREEWEGAVSSLMKRHKARQKRAGRTLAAFVPRFYGMTPQQVLEVSVNEADARIAIARGAGHPSWNALLTAETPDRKPNDYWEITPHQRAVQAIHENDVEKLKEILQNNPAVLNPSPYEREHGGTLANSALGSFEAGSLLTPLSPKMRAYLESIGVDLQTELHMRLSNPFTARSVENVRVFLDAGADPDWVAPNRFSMLEQALVVLHNREVIDLLASRSTPRKALWISAGLGDVQGVASFLDRNGKPTAAARELRSPFDCARFSSFVTPLYDPDDDELFMEALSLAAFNGRANVIDYLATRGVNLDNMAWGVPIVNIAAGNGWLDSVEALVRNGANLDIPSQNDSNGSAREMARWRWRSSNDSPTSRRIAELCGLDITALRAEREATTPKDPPFQQKLKEALAYAQQAALQQKVSAVSAENLLMGMLRLGGLPLLFYANLSRLDRERFKADIMPAAQAIQGPAAGISVPYGTEVQGFLEDARAMAKERYSSEIGVLNVLYAMTRLETGYAVDLVRLYGGSVLELNRELRRSVLNVFE